MSSRDTNMLLSPEPCIRQPTRGTPSPMNTPQPTPPNSTTVGIPAVAAAPTTEQQAASRSTTPTLENLTWERIDVDSVGTAIGVFGISFTQFSSKQLRSICSQLSIRGVKNVKKQLMIDHIVNHVKNRKAYDSIDASPTNVVATPEQGVPLAATIANTTRNIAFRIEDYYQIKTSSQSWFTYCAQSRFTSSISGYEGTRTKRRHFIDFHWKLN